MNGGTADGTADGCAGGIADGGADADAEGDKRSLLHAFEGYGIEVEYMIVDRRTLSVAPLADRLLSAAGGGSHEVRHGALGWSNELALHVIEVKNLRPAATLEELPQAFQREVREINRALKAMDAQLMPGAMHPWMDPRSETRLWPHEHSAIYRAYERIFDTRSHGWANLQSMHVNLPFNGDIEFSRLHAAIRLLLPILPALAASSPVADGCLAGCADYRMRVYCDNADGIPSIAGTVVPETVATRDEYENRILAPMYADIAARDPDRLLQHEWLNSRGAIARFDRSAIEIRVLDSQECAQADIAVAAAVSAAVRMLYEAGEQDLCLQQEMQDASLAAILQDCIRDADLAVIADPAYLALLGLAPARCSAGEAWQQLIARMQAGGPGLAPQFAGPLRTILEQGPLARRIMRAAGGSPKRERLAEIYRSMCACLQDGAMFSPD